MKQSEPLVLSNLSARRVHLHVSAIIRDLIMAVLLVWLVCPYQAFFQNWVLYGVLWILWWGFALLSNMSAVKSALLNPFSLGCFIWPLTLCFLSFFNWAEFSVYQFTIPFILISFSYYAKGNYCDSLKFFLVVYFIYAILINFHSISQLWINPNTSRILANSDQSVTIYYAGPFMANFSYINNLPALSILLVYGIKHNFFNTKSKIFFFAVLLINCYLLILAEYMIAMLMFVVFLLYVLLIQGENKSNSKLRLIICILLIPFVLVLTSPILKWIAELIGEGRIAERLSSIGEFLGSGSVGEGSDFQKRWLRYQRSLISIADHPIFGVGRTEYMAGGLVGGHSEILDNFAYYGLFFGSLFVVYLINAYKNAKRFLRERFLAIYRILFLIYFLNCLVNAAYTEEMLIVTFFVLPSMLFVCQKGSEERELSGCREQS